MTTCSPACSSCIIINTTQQKEAYCQCNYPWANVGDLAPDPSIDCSINFQANKILHGICAGLWFIGVFCSILGLVKVKRSSRQHLMKETLMLFILFLASIFYFVFHLLETISNTPGSQSLGINLTSTILWSCGLFFTFGFLFSVPFIKSGTSVLPYALQNSTARVKKIALPVIIFVFVLCQTAPASVLVMIFFPAQSALILRVQYSLIVLWTFAICGMFIVLTSGMMAKTQGLLTSSDLSTSQRSKIIITYKTAKRVRTISMIGMILNVPPALAFAISSSLARQSYIIICLNSFTLSGVVVRHAINSFRMSMKTSLDGASRSGHITTKSAKKEQMQLSEEGTNTVDDTMPSTIMKTLGKKSRYKKFGKVPHKKSMTHITEENSIDQTSIQHIIEEEVNT